MHIPKKKYFLISIRFTLITFKYTDKGLYFGWQAGKRFKHDITWMFDWILNLRKLEVNNERMLLKVYYMWATKI